MGRYEFVGQYKKGVGNQSYMVRVLLKKAGASLEHRNERGGPPSRQDRQDGELFVRPGAPNPLATNAAGKTARDLAEDRQRTKKKGQRE